MSQKANKEDKYIIALSSSPSRGRNSDSMLDAFIRGMGHVSGVRVEKIYLYDIPIDYYTFENKEGPKFHEIEFKALTDKMHSANGMIIATPTYNFSVPAHLKNFIDRIRFFALDFENKNKLGQPKGMLSCFYTYFLVSGGIPNWAEKILFFTFPPFWLRGVFLYYGARVMGAIYSGDVRTFENHKVLEKCERAGKRFATKVLKNRRHGILEDIFWRPPQIKE